MITDSVNSLLKFYPMIYFACHTRHVTDKNTGVKLTANQLSILDHLDLMQGTSLFELATHMGVTPSTMSISIERLFKLGYIEKNKDEKDARKTKLTLNIEGDRMKKSKSVLDPEKIENMLKRLSEVEIKQALGGLALLAQAAEMEMKSKSLSKSWKTRNSKSQ